MSDSPSIREKIIAELLLRLQNAKGKSKQIWIYEGQSSISTIENYPSVFLFEMLEESVLEKPGRYVKTLPIQIEYLSKVSDKKLIPSVGRDLLKVIAAAIETDDRFSNLVLSYYMTANQVFELRDGIVDVVVVYDFRYADRMLGHNSERVLGLAR
jgi:hypothetical protein